MVDWKLWTGERPKMWTFYIFEPLKAHTYEPNISLIRLMLIMQNPKYLSNLDRVNTTGTNACFDLKYLFKIISN